MFGHAGIGDHAVDGAGLGDDSLNGGVDRFFRGDVALDVLQAGSAEFLLQSGEFGTWSVEVQAVHCGGGVGQADFCNA